MTILIDVNVCKLQVLHNIVGKLLVLHKNSGQHHNITKYIAPQGFHYTFHSKYIATISIAHFITCLGKK